tara:strand:+ start:1585 stop:2664 length:1080 start_codon:yes stop_codon:yes gene_type:complete
MTKAIITLKNKNKRGGIHTLQSQIKSAIKKKNLSIKVELLDNSVISVPIGLPQRELESILAHVKIPYFIEYVKENNGVIVSKSKIPGDYGLLQGNLKRLASENKTQKLELSKLTNKLNEEVQSRLTIQADLNDAIAQYKEIFDASDFVTQNMLRGNALWNNFIKFYTDTLEHASKIYEIPIDVLEREVLTFDSLQERTDFMDIARDLENAKEAKVASERNPLLKMDSYAEQVLNKAAKIEKRQDAISDVRRELGAQIGKKKLWIVLSADNKDSLLTLPYTYREDEKSYHILEQPLIEAVNQSLTNSKLTYTQEGVDGLLRYVIPGMKSRARTKLSKTISSTGDAFVKLCGERKVVGITG